MLRMRFALLVAIVAVAGHDATYALVHGQADYRAVLTATGHDAYWGSVTASVASLLAATLIATGLRWWQLRRRLRSMTRAPSLPATIVRPVRVAGQAIRLALVALAVFTVQELIEILAVGSGASVAMLLGVPGLLLSVVVFLAIALPFASLSELIDAHVGAIEAVLARPPLPRASRAAVRPMRDADPHAAGPPAQVRRGRAPPLMAASPAC